MIKRKGKRRKENPQELGAPPTPGKEIQLPFTSGPAAWLVPILFADYVQGLNFSYARKQVQEGTVTTCTLDGPQLSTTLEGGQSP